MEIITIIAIVYFIIVIFLIIFYQKDFIYALPISIVFTDTLFFETTIFGFNFTDVKPVFIFSFALLAIYSTKLKGYRLNVWVLLFIVFSLIKIILDTENTIRSLLSFMNISGSLIVFFAAYNYIKTQENLDKVIKVSLWLMSLFVLNFVISNIFNLGFDSYELGIYGGYLVVERSFFAALIIIITPYYILKSKKKNKLLVIIIWILSMIIILLLLRRSAIIIMIGGLGIVYLYYAKNIFNLITRLIPAIIIIIIIIISNKDIINDYYTYYELRGRALDRNIEEQIMVEGRTEEIIFVFSDIFSFSDLKRSLVGDDYFYTEGSIGKYAGGKFGNRPMHTFIGQILHHTGILGFIIYTLIQFKFIMLYFRINKYTYNSNSLNLLKYIYLALLFVFIISNYTKGFNTESFSILFYLYLGGIYGVLSDNQVIKRNIN